MDSIFDIWGSDIVTGDSVAPLPPMCAFSNIIAASELLHKHLSNSSNIAIHCDVDVDGIGTGYIAKRYIESISNSKLLFTINKDKEHGIQEKHSNYFNNTGIQLMIVLDSSSNELEIIKQFKCDVLVIDHHECPSGITSGTTNSGHTFLILNNTLPAENNERVNTWLAQGAQEASDLSIQTPDIPPYTPTDAMSCGLVLYEFFRVYQSKYIHKPVLENLRLSQWSAITLLTDAVPMTNDRNQWYIANTVGSNNIEPNLQSLAQAANKYQTTINKGFVSFSLAPMINMAIRADAGAYALDTVLNNPSNIQLLNTYREEQTKALSIGKLNPSITPYFISKDITTTGVSKNYAGVIASSLCGEYKLPCIVYIIKDNLACGSFRGSNQSIDYLAYFKNHNSNNKADGHKAAFGFKVPIENLASLLSDASTLETTSSTRYYITAGSMPDELKGEHHIRNLDEFKMLGNLWRLGIGNSRVSNQEQLEIMVPLRDISQVATKGKLHLYTILGLECKAFEVLKSTYIKLYVEQSNMLEIYARN